MFWDSSALVPVLLPERRSADVDALLAGDRGVTIWKDSASSPINLGVYGPRLQPSRRQRRRRRVT